MHFLLAFDELSPIYLKKECLTGVEQQEKSSHSRKMHILYVHCTKHRVYM
jgi:hypothetical protein